MQLFNLRFGFANNSSSTHSMIYKSANDTIKEKVTSDFGWDNFTLITAGKKRLYLGSILFNYLERLVGENFANHAVRSYLDIKESKIPIIDHQSCPVFPKKYGYNQQATWMADELDFDFIEEYKNFILQNDLVILGGNDNDDGDHPLAVNAFTLPLLYDRSWDNVISRKDANGFWTIFDQKNGTKTRVKFTHEKFDPPKSADTPELVDLKITNNCPFGCKYCYQDSTPNGAHATKEYIFNILSSLHNLKVFEVAIGGGEPTLHPNFIEILEWCVRNGIVPNFTTRNLNWLMDREQREKILKLIGSFAFSVDTANQVKKLGFLLGQENIDFRPQIQVVLGAVDQNQFTEIVKECSYHNFPLTLLGFKEVGRGQNYKKKYNFDWISIIKNLAEHKQWVKLGIDTVVAKECKANIEAWGIYPYLYNISEGTFSCYIDAVTKTIGPSSYDPDNMKSLEFDSAEDRNPNNLTKKIKKLFNSFSEDIK